MLPDLIVSSPLQAESLTFLINPEINDATSACMECKPEIPGISTSKEEAHNRQEGYECSFEQAYITTT